MDAFRLVETKVENILRVLTDEDRDLMNAYIESKIKKENDRREFFLDAFKTVGVAIVAAILILGIVLGIKGMNNSVDLAAQKTECTEKITIIAHENDALKTQCINKILGKEISVP
jgi:hypothetical protein